MRRLPRSRPAALLAACVTVLAGTACVTQRVGGGEQEVGPVGVQPALVVERFLQAANANDWSTMARLFGTKDGSINDRDERGNVERRMNAIASIMKHDDYKLDAPMAVAGRSGQAVRIGARLTQGDQQVTVPFVLVRAKGDAWLVEQIDIEAVTGRR